MKKQIVSLVMAFVLVFNVFSLPAKAEYTVHFNILPSMDEMERRFRNWAANLVDYYQNTYAVLDGSQESVRTMTWDPIEWYDSNFDRLVALYDINNGNYFKEVWVKKEKTLYHPYYWVAEQKINFDGTTDANAENILHMRTKETAYSMLDLMEDPTKRLEIYTWLLIETLKEKAEVQPDFLAGNAYIEGNPGCYSFDIETGKMKYDPALNAVNEQAWANAKADLGKAAASLLEVAVTTYFATKDLEEKWYSIASNAVSQISGEMNWSNVKDVLINGLRDAIKDTVFDTIDKAIEDVRTNFNNEMTNVIRGYLSAELANKMLVANANVIGYLRTTYVTNQIFILDSAANDVAGFRDAAANLIRVIDSQDFKDATQSEAQRIVEEYTANIMDFKEVVPTNVIVYNITSYALVSLVDGVFNALINTLQDALDQAINNEPAWLKSATTSLKDFLVVDFLQNWVLESIKEGIKDTLAAYAPDSGKALSSDADETAIGGYSKSFFDNLQNHLDVENAISSLSAQLITRATTAVANLVIVGVKNDNASDITSNQKTVDAALEQYQDADFFNGNDVTQDPIATMAVCIIATMIKTPIENVSSNVSEKFSFMSGLDQNALKNNLKALTKVFDSIEKGTNNVEKFYKFARDFEIQMISLIEWAGMNNNKYPDHNLFSSLVNAFIDDWNDLSAKGAAFAYTSVAVDAITTFIKDKTFLQAIITLITGINADETLKNADIVNSYHNIYYEYGDKNAALYQETATDAVEEAETGLARTLSDLANIVSAVWESALDFASDFWTAVNSTTDALTGEDLASLDATRIRITADNSRVLEAALSVAVKGGRTQRQGNTGESDEAIVAVYDNDRFNVWMMSAEDIRNPSLTPNLKHIKELTDVIRMQMNLDVTGMGVYLTMVTNLPTFSQTTFYKKYLNGGVLLWPNAAQARYNLVVNAAKIGDGYNHEWDVLFETAEEE